jgi:hypothetical protein
MRGLLVVMGALGVILGAVALVVSFGKTESALHEIEALIAFLIAAVAFGALEIINAIERTGAQQIEAARPAPAESDVVAPAEASVPGAEAARTEEAKGLLKQAQDRHFDKQFAEATELYERVIKRFPDTKQAEAARQQIENLKTA